MQPDLLSAGVKLEPLDVVDVAATLPEISPNYKPLPRFSPPTSPVWKKPKMMSEEEALSSIMAQKNLRSVTYYSFITVEVFIEYRCCLELFFFLGYSGFSLTYVKWM